MRKLSLLFITGGILGGCNPCCNNVCDPCCEVVNETYVHKYGVEVPGHDWDSRGKNGQVISNLKNGVTVTKTYTKGILDGDTIYTFPHSDQIEKIESYSKGFLVTEKIFYLYGTPMREIRHHSGTGKTITDWYETGIPQSVEEFEGSMLVEAEYFTPNHQVESRVDDGKGMRICRDQYGQLASHDQIVNGTMVLRSTFHPNGSLKEVIPYKDNLVEGKKKTYFPGGEPNTIEEWALGKQHGTTIVFKNGEMYSQIPYICGEKYGTERIFRDGKVLVEEISWVGGIKQGPKYTYIGDAVKSDWYHRNQLVSKSHYDLLNPPVTN